MRTVRDVIAALLDRVSGGPGLFPAVMPTPAVEASQVLVLSPGRIPTTDFYLRQRLADHAPDRYRIVDTLAQRPPPSPVPNGFVVIVRWCPAAWLGWLATHRDRLAGVALLLDDDTPDALRCDTLPLRYAVKTAWRFARMRRALGALRCEVWVSTREMQRRHAATATRLCEPVYLPSLAAVPRPAGLIYFYHGSAAHRREIAWLVDVVRRVQAEVDDAVFEIIGNAHVRRLFRGIPRVRVLAPMPWPDYLDRTSRERRDVGLAPCFDTPFNRARSHVKLFDITRAGAAGVYSDRAPYRGTVQDDRTGVLCPDSSDAWVDAITTLLRDDAHRHDLHAAALRWCETSGSPPFEGLPRVVGPLP